MQRVGVLASLILLLAGCAELAPKPHYVVFFQRWSAALDPAAQKIVQDAAVWAKQHPWQTAEIHGYADPGGTLTANNGISALRSQAVADMLVSDGMEYGRIRQVADGPVVFAADPQESRRAEIVFFGP